MTSKPPLIPPAPRAVWPIILAAVFVVATVAASLGFVILGGAGNSGRFLSRLAAFAVRYGWVSGVVVAALFWLLNRNAKPPPGEKAPGRGERAES